MTPDRPLITLTTDFGERNDYVGIMKGVIPGLAPAALVVDLTHALPPQGSAEAAFVLYTAYRYFPAHTVPLVVMDPGVGSARRPLAVRSPAGQPLCTRGRRSQATLKRRTIRGWRETDNAAPAGERLLLTGSAASSRSPSIKGTPWRRSPSL